MQKISRNLLLNSAKTLYPMNDAGSSSCVSKNEANSGSCTSLLQMALKRKRPLFDSENEHLLKQRFFLTTSVPNNSIMNSTSSKLGQIRPNSIISQQRFIISNRNIKTESSLNHPNLTQLLLNKSNMAEDNQGHNESK